MSSEPPSDTSQGQEEGLDQGSSGRDAGHGHRPDTEKRLWTTVAAVAGVLAVAWGVAAFLLFSAQPEALDEERSPREGLACPFLRQAAEAYERGERAALGRTIARAAGVAEGTLQNSGQVFGEPERIALELELGTQARIEELLTQAKQACSPLGQWNAAST
jgi:hypothetical protein